MIRKHTTFFDKSLRFLTDKELRALEAASEVHDKIVQLIRLISISEDSDMTYLLNGRLLEYKIDGKQGEVLGVVMGRQFADDLMDATQETYRLETAIKFLVNEESETNVKPREIVVVFHFFQKAAKSAHFWIKLYIDNDGYAYHVEGTSFDGEKTK